MDADEIPLDALIRRYRDLFDFAPEGYLITTPMGNILDVNRAAADLLNFSPNFLIGKPLIAFIERDERRALVTDLFRLRRSGLSSEWQVRMLRRGAPPFDALLRVQVVHAGDGAAESVRWSLRDITEQKQAHERLEHYAARLQHLHMIDRIILTARSPNEVAVASLSAVQQLIPSQQVNFTIFDHVTDSAVTRIISADASCQPIEQRAPLAAFALWLNLTYVQPRLVADLATPAERLPSDEQLLAAGIRATLSIPLIAQETAIGVLVFGAAAPAAFTADHVETAVEVANQLAVAIQHLTLFAELQASEMRQAHLARRLLDLQETERRYLANELHDEIGQALTGLQLILATAIHPPPDRPPEYQQQRLSEAQAVINDLLARVSSLSLDLRPPALDRQGLLPALAWHIERYTAQTGVRVNFQHLGIDRRFAPEVETAIYRVIQEALTNVARHAGVAVATVQVLAEEEMIALQVADQGRGFDMETTLRRGTATRLCARVCAACWRPNRATPSSARPKMG